MAESDPLDSINKWLRSRGPIGRVFYILLAVLISVGTVWWQWDHVRSLPGVPQLVRWIEERKPIHPVSEDKLTIAVARLESDPDRRNEKLLLAELEKFDGLAVLPIDRLVELPSGGTRQESITQAQERARALLGQSNAQALIWGSVLEHDGHSALQLHWTVARGETGRSDSGRYQPDSDLNLPGFLGGPDQDCRVDRTNAPYRIPFTRRLLPG